MAFIGALVLLSFTVQYGINGALDNLNRFAMDDTFKGHKCLDEKIVFEITNGKSVCALRCWMDLACSSIIYYPDIGKCIGCTSFTGVDDPLQNNSVFYKRGYQYLGCYDDSPRILIEYNVQTSPSQSTENCVTRCRSQDASFSVTELEIEFVNRAKSLTVYWASLFSIFLIFSMLLFVVVVAGRPGMPLNVGAVQASILPPLKRCPSPNAAGVVQAIRVRNVGPPS